MFTVFNETTIEVSSTLSDGPSYILIGLGIRTPPMPSGSVNARGKMTSGAREIEVGAARGSSKSSNANKPLMDTK